MGHQVNFFCGPEDDRALIDYAASIGLQFLPGVTDYVDKFAKEGFPWKPPYNKYGGVLSFLPLDQLHPRENAKGLHVIDGVKDPVLAFTRAFYEPPYLVRGRIYWSDDNEEIMKPAKPYFDKLARWVRKNWRKRPNEAFYFGPHAERLVDQEGARPVDFPPGTKIRTIEI